MFWKWSKEQLNASSVPENNSCEFISSLSTYSDAASKVWLWNFTIAWNIFGQMWRSWSSALSLFRAVGLQSLAHNTPSVCPRTFCVFNFSISTFILLISNFFIPALFTQSGVFVFSIFHFVLNFFPPHPVKLLCDPAVHCKGCTSAWLNQQTNEQTKLLGHSSYKSPPPQPAMVYFFKPVNIIT